MNKVSNLTIRHNGIVIEGINSVEEAVMLTNLLSGQVSSKIKKSITKTKTDNEIRIPIKIETKVRDRDRKFGHKMRWTEEEDKFLIRHLDLKAKNLASTNELSSHSKRAIESRQSNIKNCHLDRCKSNLPKERLAKILIEEGREDLAALLIA